MTAHQLCGYGARGGGGNSGVSPRNTIYGDCGTLSVYTFNSGGGWMQWKGEITSSAGPFVAAGYTGSWLNLNTNGSGPVGRSFVGLTSDWLDIFPVYTHTGLIYSKITYAWDRLWWGGLCTSAGVPWSYVTVT